MEVTLFGSEVFPLTSYDVTLDASPVDFQNLAGGAPSVSIDTVLTNQESLKSLGSNATFTDPMRGTVAGTIVDYSREGIEDTSPTKLKITSFLERMNVDILIRAHNGTRKAYIEKLFDAVGITNYVAPSLLDTYAIPGWKGNLWEHFKQMCVVWKLECYLDDNIIKFRNLRSHEVVLDANKLTSLSLETEPAKGSVAVEVKWNNAEYKVDSLVYHPDHNYTLEASEVQEYFLTIDATLNSVNNPQIVDKIIPIPYVDPTEGKYVVFSTSNKPIEASTWTNRGGYIRVYLTDNPNEIRLVIGVASDIDGSAPYVFEERDGGTNPPSLYITGTGVFTVENSVILYTGEPLVVGDTEEVSSAAVESPFIRTQEEALQVGHSTAAAHSGYKTTLTGSIPFDIVEDGYQEFSAIPGARISYLGSYYRIISATITYGGIDFSALQDFLFDDWESYYSGQTFTQIQTYLGSSTFNQIQISPTESAYAS